MSYRLVMEIQVPLETPTKQKINQRTFYTFSGSPLILASTREMIGITSFVKDAEDGKALRSNDCGSNVAPSVFVRVASYLDWIREKTGHPIG
jgi:secreted trypsin-like serine protease